MAEDVRAPVETADKLEGEFKYRVIHTQHTFYNYTHVRVGLNIVCTGLFELVWFGLVLFHFVCVDESVLFIIITKQSICWLASLTFATTKTKCFVLLIPYGRHHHQQ